MRSAIVVLSVEALREDTLWAMVVLFWVLVAAGLFWVISRSEALSKPEKWAAYAVIVLILFGPARDAAYGVTWIGFGEDTINKEATTQDLRRAKTLWDWMQLLIVPALLAAGGFWFSSQQAKRNEKSQEAQRERELEIEDRRAQDAALQAYIVQMGQLLMEKDLGSSFSLEEIEQFARALTLTVLERLSPGPNGDPRRSPASRHKSEVLRFLHEADLITSRPPIVGLKKANLTYASLVSADLFGANLSRADLSGANLECANLQGAFMVNTDLKGTRLNGADLSRARLSTANMEGASLEGAIVIDADLSGANVTNEQLKKCASLEESILPDGTTFQKSYLDSP